MKKFTVISWYTSAFFKKHKKILILSSTLGVFFAVFLIWVLPFIPRPNPEINIGLVGQYRRNQLPQFITSKVGQGLTTVLQDGTPVAAIAKDWSINDDGTIYTFFLRKDLFWQDNTSIKAQDFNYKFEGVESIVLDENTLQFKLQNPYTPFLTLVSQPTLKNNLYGTAEYKIISIEEKSGYLDKVIIESKKEKIRVKFYPNLPKALTSYKLGEIDEIREIYSNPFKDNSQWLDNAITTKIQDTNQYIGLFLNNNDPYLGDKTFRQALAYATQKPEDDSRTKGPISKTSWAFNDDIKPYNYDAQRAIELLEKSLGSLDKANDFTLHIGTTQTFLEIAEEIEKKWEETLPIKVETQVINSLSDDFQILLLSQQIPLDPDQYALWHSTQSQNIVHFNNVRIDKILEDARVEKDIETRKELYNDFQRFFVEECPVIFLTYPDVYTIRRKSIIKPFTRALLNFGIEQNPQE